MSVLVTTNFVFALLNALLIVYLIWYGLVRYLIPSLRSGMRMQQQQRVNQQHVYDKALLDYESIKRQRMLYDTQAQQLLVAIGRWKERVEQKKQQEKQQYMEQVNAIQAYMKEQQQYGRITLMQEYVIAHAYEQAVQTLQKKYSNQAAGKEVLRAIVASLESNTHE